MQLWWLNLGIGINEGSGLCHRDISQDAFIFPCLKFKTFLMFINNQILKFGPKNINKRYLSWSKCLTQGRDNLLLRTYLKEKSTNWADSSWTNRPFLLYFLVLDWNGTMRNKMWLRRSRDVQDLSFCFRSFLAVSALYLFFFDNTLIPQSILSVPFWARILRGDPLPKKSH